MQERHIVVEGESGIISVSHRGVWGVMNTRPVVILWKRQRTPHKIDRLTFMRCCFSVVSDFNVGPVLSQHWWMFHAHQEWYAPMEHFKSQSQIFP